LYPYNQAKKNQIYHLNNFLKFSCRVSGTSRSEFYTNHKGGKVTVKKERRKGKDMLYLYYLSLIKNHAWLKQVFGTCRGFFKPVLTVVTYNSIGFKIAF